MKHKTPILEIDLKKVINQYQLLASSLYGCRVFYAVKANPEREVLRILDEQGSSFEIASLGELERLIEIGVSTKRVIFSNPVKIPFHIERAFKLGVCYFAFDTAGELEKIARYAPGANVYLRLDVSNTGSQIKLSAKFGCNKTDAVNLMCKARELSLVPVGITFHVGSQAEQIDVWGQAIKDVRDVMISLLRHDMRLDFVNVGGGFPAPYGGQAPKIAMIASEIKKAVKRLPYKLELWCEPGRYLVAEAGTIHSHVIGRAMRRDGHWLYLDTGRFQSFIELFESEDIMYSVWCNRNSKKKLAYTLTGPTCDSFDTIMHNVLLPENIEVGDRISFGMCGAYTHVYGAPFNDFPVPVVTYTKTE